MMYFIPWVIFLLFVILSVPIAAWLEKRKMQSEAGFDDEPEASSEDAGEAESEEAAAEQEPAEPEPAFDSGGGFGGEDDFSSFEELS